MHVVSILRICFQVSSALRSSLMLVHVQKDADHVLYIKCQTVSIHIPQSYSFYHKLLLQCS